MWQRVFGQSWWISVLAVEGLRDVELSPGILPANFIRHNNFIHRYVMTWESAWFHVLFTT